MQTVSWDDKSSACIHIWLLSSLLTEVQSVFIVEDSHCIQEKHQCIELHKSLRSVDTPPTTPILVFYIPFLAQDINGRGKKGNPELLQFNSANIYLSSMTYLTSYEVQALKPFKMRPVHLGLLH